LKVKIIGMSCEHCVRAVTRALLAVPGVTSATVSLQEKCARVEGNPDPEAVIEAIKNEGYEAEFESS